MHRQSVTAGRGVWLGGCVTLRAELEACALLSGLCPTAPDAAEVVLFGSTLSNGALPTAQIEQALQDLDATRAAALRQLVWIVHPGDAPSGVMRGQLADQIRQAAGQAALRLAPRVRVNAILAADATADTLSRPMAWLLGADAVTGQLLHLQPSAAG